MGFPLLKVDRLETVYRTGKKEEIILKGVSLRVETGEWVGLIGESGSGKTTLSDAILQVLPWKGGRVLSGKIFYKGIDLSHKEIQIIGRDIAYIPQDPGSSLDPLYPVEDQFIEIIREHKQSQLSADSSKTAVRVLDKKGKMIHGIDLSAFPHQLSGGMKQRILIGLALQAVPKLILADEPTSNLDVSLERKVLELFKQLKEEEKMSFLMTTHNLALAKRYCDRIYVLFRGVIVEEGTPHEIFEHPEHPYTKKLVQACL